MLAPHAHVPRVREQAEISGVLGSITPQDVAAMPSTHDWVAEDTMPPLAGKAWHDVLRVQLTAGQTKCTSYGPEFEELLSSLLCCQPTARLSAAQTLAHPFFVMGSAEH